MKLIILAAGIGKRLRPLTKKVPKPLVRINDNVILKRLLEQFESNGIIDAIIVIGHMGHKIKEAIGSKIGNMKIHYFENKDYESTNNIVSLWLAKEFLNDDIMLVEGDVICEPALIKSLCKNEHKDWIAVNSYREGLNGTFLSIKDGKVIKYMLPKEQGEDFNPKDKFKTANFYKLSKETLLNHYIHLLDKHIKNKNLNEYHEIVLKELIEKENVPIFATIVDNFKWVEIDNRDDLKLAKEMFK